MHYDLKIPFRLNEPFDVSRVNRVYNQYRNYNYKILVEVQNTKGISSWQIKQLPPNVLIRVAGGYDDEKVWRNKNLHYENGETGEYYETAVIYTRNETIKILEEIEKIEAGIKSNWSDIQKVVYVYDRLKRQIMYDPKHENKPSSEVRSLRGLITKQTVCAGYAIIFKEIMDRQGIKCEYVEGNKNTPNLRAHAWNIVTINGKKYPIDLTWDNTKFRSGRFETFDFLGQDIETFSREHYPDPWEPTQNYRYTLSQIDHKIIKKIYSQINRDTDYKTTTYSCTRGDGSKFTIAQIGHIPVVGRDYYRYYYADISADGRRETPRIFYGTENITELVEKKKFGKYIDRYYEKAIGDVLFSKNNIANSISQNTNYIGGLETSVYGNYYEVIKPEEHKRYFSYPTKTFRRSDGSIFIAQKIPSIIEVKGIKVMKYIILEMVREDGREHLKENIVFTEKDFFLDNSQRMVDDFLSRSRLDRKLRDAGSYIGYYSSGIRYYNPDLLKHFDTSKRIDIDPPVPKKPTIKLPSFYELEFLATTYETFYEGNKIKVRDIKTKEVLNDEKTIIKAKFANIWLSSAGLKRTPGDVRFGETQAFSSEAKKLYDIMCKKLQESCKKNSVIDTVDLFKFIYEYSYHYKDGEKIIANLFNSIERTEEINKLFLASVGIEEHYTQEKPTTLYSVNYAYNLAYPSFGHSSRIM